MKRFICILLGLMLLGAVALAESEDAAVNTLIDEGGFVIQIDVDDDLGWVADDMAQDDSVVELYEADVLEGTFVARYQPTGDGDVTVGVRHYTGIACDHYLSWDLRVADGAVQEVIGGSETFAPDEAEADPYLLGEWLEAQAPYTQMTIEKNPERGWDVEIASPMSHGAYIFKTTIYFDCEQNSFVYDKGKYWEVPVTDSDEDVELGEASVAGTTGCFTFVGDPVDVYLSWYDDQRPEEEVIFAPADAAEEADADIDEEAADDIAYADPHGDLSFSYSPDAFFIDMDDEGDGEHLVTLGGAREDWGEYFIRFHLAELDDGETFPELADFSDIEEDLNTQVSQGEWNGFDDVISYPIVDDESLEMVFIVPLADADDGEVDAILTVNVYVGDLENEEEGMARDDAISAVLDTLEILDD